MGKRLRAVRIENSDKTELIDEEIFYQNLVCGRIIETSRNVESIDPDSGNYQITRMKEFMKKINAF